MVNHSGGLAVGVAVIAMSGCVAPETTPEAIQLSPMARPFERDVPVPSGFAFVESASEDASSGARRMYLRHCYAGRAAKINVRAFYREQMPLTRWVKQDGSNVKGEYTMRFRKGGERCEVRIRDHKNHRGMVEIMVLIMPIGSEQAPPARRKR